MASLAAFVLSGAMSLLRFAHEKQVLQSAARLGTFLQTRAGVAETDARFVVEEYLREQNVLATGETMILAGRYLDTSAARFYNFGRTRIEKTNAGFLPGRTQVELICEREEE
jgi:hypothetical protein